MMFGHVATASNGWPFQRPGVGLFLRCCEQARITAQLHTGRELSADVLGIAILPVEDKDLLPGL